MNTYQKSPSSSKVKPMSFFSLELICCHSGDLQMCGIVSVQVKLFWYSFINIVLWVQYMIYFTKNPIAWTNCFNHNDSCTILLKKNSHDPYLTDEKLCPIHVFTHHSKPLSTLFHPRDCDIESSEFSLCWNATWGLSLAWLSSRQSHCKHDLWLSHMTTEPPYHWHWSPAEEKRYNLLD